MDWRSWSVLARPEQVWPQPETVVHRWLEPIGQPGSQLDVARTALDDFHVTAQCRQTVNIDGQHGEHVGGRCGGGGIMDADGQLPIAVLEVHVQWLFRWPAGQLLYCRGRQIVNP
jgi:hypothetical protein